MRRALGEHTVLLQPMGSFGKPVGTEQLLYSGSTRVSLHIVPPIKPCFQGAIVIAALTVLSAPEPWLEQLGRRNALSVRRRPCSDGSRQYPRE